MTAPPAARAAGSAPPPWTCTPLQRAFQRRQGHRRGKRQGGVGKSTVTCSLAAAMARLGKKTAVLDADITGPSVPTAFGIHEHAVGSELGIYPAVSKGGVALMSLNLLTENETDPVIWRGPVIAGTVKQFWTDVIWGDVDYMFVDMPRDRRRAPHRVPVPARGRCDRGHLSPGPGVHDRHQGGENGGDDEHPHSGAGGKLQLLQVS